MTEQITKRIDAITKIAPEYLSPTPPAPKSVKIELTARCDFNCFFCATGQRLREKRDMDFGLYRRIVKDLREAGVEELGVFYLGESFMVPWLPEAIKYAKDIGFPYMFITTNGRLATPKKVRACIEAGLDSLKFSYNNANGAQLKEVAKVKACIFDEIVENIKGARAVRDEIEQRTGHRCGLYASSIQFDGTQKELMDGAVSQIVDSVDQHYYLPLYNQGALTTEVSMDKGFIPTAGNQGRLGALRKPVPCWSAFTEGHVTFDGKLSACCFDHSADWHMGDLATTPFMTAWHSEKFQALRQAHLDETLEGTPCEKCVAYN